MKRSFSGIFFAVCAALLLLSCKTPPPASADIAPAVQEAPLAAVESAPSVQTDPVVPAAETVPSDASLSDEQSAPENPQTIPAVPSPDKLLYFYPEPDLLVSGIENTPPVSAPVPVKPAPAKTVSEKTAVPKAVPEKTPPAKAETTPPIAVAKTEVPPVAGIWESEPVAPPVNPKAVLVPPSRSASVSVGQTLEVLYPGSGWVFLGDASAQNGLGYEKRKLEKTDTLFTFRALKAGNYILNFSRFDVLEDAFSSDSLAVTVSDSDLKRNDTVRSPGYRAAAGTPNAGTSASLSLTAASAAPASPTMIDEPVLKPGTPLSGANPAASVPASDAADLLKKAQTALAGKDPPTALNLLDAYFSVAVASLDEGWFLRGQAYEANSPSRDVRKALDAYETLVSAYPDSLRWKEADARIRYIKQFYQKIR